MIKEFLNWLEKFLGKINRSPVFHHSALGFWPANLPFGSAHSHLRRSQTFEQTQGEFDAAWLVLKACPRSMVDGLLAIDRDRKSFAAA